MSEKQFEEFLADRFLSWAETDIKPGFRYQFKSPNADYCQRLFRALEKRCNNSIVVKDTNIPCIEKNGSRLLVVLHGESNSDIEFTENFISMLRDEVSTQSGNMTGVSMLVIHNSLLDTLVNSAQDLSQPEYVWNPREIKEALKELINQQGSGKEVSEGLLDYQFNAIEEDDATMFGFEPLYDAVKDGEIRFSELDLFNDRMLFEMDNKPDQIRKRLEENRKLFEKISHVVENYPEALTDNLPDLGEKFVKDHFLGDDKDAWKKLSFSEYRAEQDKNRVKLLELESEASIQGEIIPRAKSETKAGKRNRHVILLLSEESTEFDFETTFIGGSIGNEEIEIKSFSDYEVNKNLTKGSKRNKIVFTGKVQESPLFFRININRDITSERYQFHCLVIREKLFNIDAIRNNFLINTKNQKVILQTEDNNLIVNTALENVTALEKANQCFDVKDVGVLNFQKMANEADEIEFTLKNNNVLLYFYVEGAVATEALTLPIILDKNRCLKLFENEYFGVFNRAKNKIIVDNKEVYPKGRRLALLQKEYDFIYSDQLYFNEQSKHEIRLFEINHISEKLFLAYKNLYDYLKDKKTLISLSAWGDEVTDLVSEIVKKYHQSLEAIPENTLLSYSQGSLLRIGLLENESGKWMTPYHPVVLSYYLNLVKELEKDNCESFSKLPEITINRLNPQGLVPFLFDQRHGFTHSRIERDNAMWIHLVPQQETSYSFVSKLVKDKVTEFCEAFAVLFKGNKKSPLIINSINNGNNSELFMGIVDLFRINIDKCPIIHVNLYNNEFVFTEFDQFSESSSYDELKKQYGLDKGKGKAKENSDAVIDVLRTKLTYSKFTNDEPKQQYAHLSFFRNNEKVEVMQVDIDEEESGSLCGGLINGEASYSKQQSYVTGFGLKGVDYPTFSHLKTAKLFSTLLQPAERSNFTYRHSSAISLAVSDSFRALLERSYDSSIWTTIIDPKVTLDFFESSKDIVLIHYSDQYTNSSSYDAITVSRQTDLYHKVLEKDEGGLIGEFNAFNGEWLLKMITADPKIRKERKGILGAYKFISYLLKESEIVWVPLSIGEVIRVAGNIGLKISDSDFSRNVNGYRSGAISDDVLFVGLKDKQLFLLPLEVKTGSRPDYHKAISQAKELKRYLSEDILGPKTLAGTIFRGLFIRQIIMQIDKYRLYSVYSDDYFKPFLENKEWWLQGDYDLTDIQDYPEGFVVAHVEDTACWEPMLVEEESILKIELPLSLLSNLVSTPLNALMYGDQLEAFKYCPEKYLLKPMSELIAEETYLKKDTSEKVEEIDKPVKKEKSKNIVETHVERKKKCEDEALRILVGNKVLNNEAIYWEPTNTAKYMNPNAGIIGTMGTGKTQCTKSLITQLYRKQDCNVDGKAVGMLIFDYKSDYVDDKFCGITGAKKYRLHKLPYNPLSLYGDTPMLPIHTAVGFSETMTRAYGLGKKQQLKLENLIVEAYQRSGIELEDSNTWNKPAPTIENIWDIFLDQKRIEEDSLYAALSKLAKFKIFETDPKKMTSLFDLVNGVVVIELAGYTLEVQNLIVALTLDLFYAQMQKKGKPEVRGDFRQLNKLILVDEADNFMSQNFPSLRRILKEGREYGVGIVLSTQDITHFKTSDNDYSAYILSWVVHRVSQIKNQDIKALFNVDEKNKQECLMNTIRGLEKHHSLYVDGDKIISKIKDKAFWEIVNES